MNQTIAAKDENRAAGESYFNTLWMLLSKPTLFFDNLPEYPAYRPIVNFLVISSLFYAFCSLSMTMSSNPLLTLIFFINAVGMPFIVSGIGYPAAFFLLEGRLTYSRFFAVYAYANGTVLIAAWAPQLTWFCEIAKWILIGIGLVRACKLKKLQAGFVMLLTLTLTLTVFWLVGYLMMMLKTAL